MIVLQKNRKVAYEDIVTLPELSKEIGYKQANTLHQIFRGYDNTPAPFGVIGNSDVYVRQDILDFLNSRTNMRKRGPVPQHRG